VEPAAVARVADAHRCLEHGARAAGEEGRRIHQRDLRAQHPRAAAVEHLLALGEHEHEEVAEAVPHHVGGEHRVAAPHELQVVLGAEGDGRGVGVRLDVRVGEAGRARLGQHVLEVQVVLQHPEPLHLEQRLVHVRVALSRLREHHAAPRPQHAAQLAQHLVLVGHVVERVEARDAVDGGVREGDAVPVVGQELRVELQAVAGVEAEQLAAQLQRGRAHVDGHRAAAQAVEVRGEPAAPGREVQDRVPDAQAQLREHQAQTVEDRARVLDRAQGLVEHVAPAGGLARDRLPVPLRVPVELLRAGQQLRLGEGRMHVGVAVAVAVRAGAQARGQAAPEGRKEMPQEGETNARGGRRSRLAGGVTIPPIVMRL
jgi:hypothetical protein